MKKFFAAANTEKGFRSLFDEIFTPEKFRRIYILKGGPGTGKSTLMRNLGAVAEGEGYDVEYICCSSDPDSLDGLFIPAISTGFVDGTAPHVWHPRAVGTFEQWINLGAFWNEKMLSDRREQIEKLKQELKEKDELINSIEPIRREMIENNKEHKRLKNKYQELINELKLMKKIMDVTVYKGKWRLIKWLIKR